MPAPPAQVDEELEKRKARAARFGIALVEPPKPKTKAVPAPATVPKATKLADVRLTRSLNQSCGDTSQL